MLFPVGPRQTGRYGMVIPRFVERALSNQPIQIYGDGQQTRCFCCVHDVTGGLMKLMDCPEATGRVFNLGSNEEISIEALADRVIDKCASTAGKEFLSYEQAYGRAFDDMMRRVPSLDRINQAAQTGAVIIIGLLRGIVRPGTSQEQAMDWLVGALRESCAAAAPHGVRIALEPINRYETSLINNAQQGMELLARVGADNMGLLLDTFHMNIEDAVMEESIRACSDRIFHFHVADSNRWYPGAGHIDFRSLLDALYATGYHGYVSGEFMPMPDADTSAERGIAYLRQG